MGKRLETVEEAIEYLHGQSIREGIKEYLRPLVKTTNEDNLNGIVIGLSSILKSEGLVKVVEGELPEDWYNNEEDKLRIERTLKEADYLKVTKEWG